MPNALQGGSNQISHPKMLIRSLSVLLIVALLHFALSIAGFLFVLPAAFDAQAGIWEATGKIILVWLAAIPLAPLAWVQPFSPTQTGFGYGEIVVVSVAFGLAAVAQFHVWRAVRSRRRTVR
jgi:hypothetical protein